MTYSWLVENFTNDGQSTGLYMACQVNMTVTANPNAARKFRRQHTAEFRALDMREARRGDWRAVEHGFDDSKTPAGCSENGGLGWCDEHKPEVATRCEGCAELRDQLRDLTRQSNLDAMRVGKLAEDAERHSALHASLFVEKTAAQIDAENLREVLHRMLEAPTTQISAGWKDAIRQAMAAAVPDSKTPNAKLTGIARHRSNDEQ